MPPHAAAQHDSQPEREQPEQQQHEQHGEQQQQQQQEEEQKEQQQEHQEQQKEQQKQAQELHVDRSPAGCSRDDYRIIKTIGHGDMGTVFLVASRADNAPFAMKVMKKEVLIARDNLHRAQTERDILKRLDHRFLPRLHANFEDEKHTFLVTSYCSGGDLNVLRQKQAEKRFSEDAARFYASEVLLALEYLHKQGIVYRDLKPENILVQTDGHIMLTDFDLSLDLSSKNRNSNPSPTASPAPDPETAPATASTSTPASASASTPASDRSSSVSPLKRKAYFWCGMPSPLKLFKRARRRLKISKRRPSTRVSKIFRKPVTATATVVAAMSSGCKSNSFVGTEEYVAPEVVWGSGHGMPVDWWTFGIFLFELVFARTPFKGLRRKDTFYNILCKEAEIPGPLTPLKDLISKLLVKNPFERLGSKLGAAEVRDHAFFQGIKWDEVVLVSRPPFIPPPFSLEEVEKGREPKEADLEELLAKKRKHPHHHHNQQQKQMPQKPKLRDHQQQRDRDHQQHPQESRIQLHRLQHVQREHGQQLQEIRQQVQQDDQQPQQEQKDGPEHQQEQKDKKAQQHQLEQKNQNVQQHQERKDQKDQPQMQKDQKDHKCPKDVKERQHQQEQKDRRQQQQQAGLEQGKRWQIDNHGMAKLRAGNRNKFKGREDAPMMVTNAAAVEKICSSYDRLKAEFSAEKRFADRTKLTNCDSPASTAFAARQGTRNCGLERHAHRVVARPTSLAKCDQVGLVCAGHATPSEDLEEFQVF